MIAHETGNICRRDDLKGAPPKGGLVLADDTGKRPTPGRLDGRLASLERHPVLLAVRLQTRPPAHTGKLACQQPIQACGARADSTDHPMKVVLILNVGQIAMAIVLILELLK